MSEHPRRKRHGDRGNEEEGDIVVGYEAEACAFQINPADRIDGKAHGVDVSEDLKSRGHVFYRRDHAG